MRGPHRAGAGARSADLPVGIVSAIAGQSRFAFRFEGQAGSRGTSRCACGAMRWPRRRSSSWPWKTTRGATPGLVATVGQLDVRPGAGNVIPGAAAGSLDVRSPDDGQRRRPAPICTRSREHIAARPRTGAGLATRPGTRRHPLRSRPARPARRGRARRRLSRARTAQRRGPRRRRARAGAARGHAFRALPGRPEPSPAGIRHRRRCRRRAESDGQIPAFARTIPPLFSPTVCRHALPSPAFLFP